MHISSTDGCAPRGKKSICSPEKSDLSGQEKNPSGTSTKHPSLSAHPSSSSLRGAICKLGFLCEMRLCSG
ncbi:hypothetical protein CHARACLAT_013299 [Characodon lateralis]|uniref:Uncharacterized protein n=1 Tax=Characodon lateralis TaxID=208331 RepID=A0ABU7D093_9TELE|nr:hypothetical protein [Characodon lateralis]